MHIDTYEISIAAFDPEDLPSEDDVIENVKECIAGFLDTSCAISVVRTSSGEESPDPGTDEEEEDADEDVGAPEDGPQ